MTVAIAENFYLALATLTTNLLNLSTMNGLENRTLILKILKNLSKNIHKEKTGSIQHLTEIGAELRKTKTISQLNSFPKNTYKTFFLLPVLFLEIAESLFINFSAKKNCLKQNYRKFKPRQIKYK